MCRAAPSPQKKKIERGREGWRPAVHRLRGSQWGGGFYGYRLKFWLFYGYRLIFFSVTVNKKVEN